MEKRSLGGERVALGSPQVDAEEEDDDDEEKEAKGL